MKKKLTELTVTRIKPPATGRLDIWDTHLPAFGLRVTSNGARSYVVALRKPGGKSSVRIKIGEPGKITLAAARAKVGIAICQDRRFLARWMPNLEAFFHYRNLDVSTLKELARRWRPELAKGLTKQGKHEALADIYESIDELRYYRDNFLRIEN